jgi:alpha-ketoglutarate-dependent taurine dioxygenase
VNELNLPEEMVDDELEEEDFEIYNNRVVNHEDVSDYKEVLQE